MSLAKALGIYIIVIGTYNLAAAKTFEFAAPAIGKMATEFATALSNANDNDVFVLTSPLGVYVFEQELTISASITIMGQSKNQHPVIRQQNLNTEAIINIVEGGSLHIINIGFDGSMIKKHAFKISESINQPSNYTLIARNCLYKNLTHNVIQASSNTFGNIILFENCLFNNCQVIELIDNGFGTRASFASLDFLNCIFIFCAKGAFNLIEKPDATFGAVTINHCVFDSISTADSLALIKILGSNDISISNSVFSNTTNSSPFQLSANAKLNYCNFYRYPDIGSVTGANCYYYNPQYDSLYFTSNQALFNKANDGKNIGLIPWAYNNNLADTIAIGDNPQGYENQGVWVVPTPDEQSQWESYFLKYKNAKLRYRADDKGNVIPDFSYVGYMRGEKTLPNLPIVAIVNPIEGDATAYIQAIIDSVAQNMLPNNNSQRGAILLKKGSYECSAELKLNANGIVLRGEGQDDNGTVLIATTKSKGASLIRIGARTGELKKISASVQNIIPEYIPVGAKYVIVAKNHEFAVGNQICIYQQFNKSWVSDLKMDQIPDDGDVEQWVASDYAFNFERQICKISSGATGDSLFFYNPLVMALDAKYNEARKVYKCTFDERVVQCGAENMLLKSVYANETDEDHAWNAVYFDRAEHCWTRNITAKYFAYACSNISKYAKYISVTECTSLSPKSLVTGGRRYSFNCDGQTSLINYCTATEGRHDFVTGSRVCGPNVFSHCSASKVSNDIGPHHRWSVGTLYDMVSTDGDINVRDRSSYGTGHGWAGANQVLWNCKGKGAICQNPWVSAKNYCIGFQGKFVVDNTYGDRPRGEWDGANISGLTPSSLYLAQKTDRGLNTDFGLHDKQGFYINDSTFELKFNQTIDLNTALLVSNYKANGNAGIQGNPIHVSEIDSLCVRIFFKSIGLLLQHSTVNIKVQNIVAKNGTPLQGITEALIQTPDLRPKVFMELQKVGNGENDYVSAQSSKSGDIYLLLITQVPHTVADMEQSIRNGLGSAVRNVSADNEVDISTHDLADGYYYAFAADIEGRISEKSSRSVTIESIVLVKESETQKPTIYSFNNRLYINFENHVFKNAQLIVYNKLGQIIHAQQIYDQENTIELATAESLYFAYLQVDNKSFTQKIYLQKKTKF